MQIKKIVVAAVACSSLILSACFSFGADNKGKLNGNDKNTASRHAQAQAKVNAEQYSKQTNVGKCVWRHTIGDDNMSLLCTGESLFGNTLGFYHFEVDGDRADWVNWKDQLQYLNEEFSYCFSDYELPDYLGGVYIYNMYGTQYIWGGGDMLNPYDGWRNDCNNTTFFIARTWAQANYPDRADRCNFAFWIDYSAYSKAEVARYLGEASLPSEFTDIHWRKVNTEINGFKTNWQVYSNYKLSLNQWFNIICIETSRGLVPVYFEKVEFKGHTDTFITNMVANSIVRFRNAMEAYKAEEVVTDPDDDFGYEDYTGDEDPVHDDTDDEEPLTKESHDA